MLLGRDVMFSYPQYLDFAYNDKTSETCQFLLGMLQRKSEVLYLHSRQVANYSIATAAKLGLSARELGLIHTAALMHDIGLLSVPNSILNKFPYLSVREMAQYKRHCVAGCSMLENMEEFSGIVDLIKDHHERWDGTGYPKRLKGVNIPLGARIIAVADYYDGIVNPLHAELGKIARRGGRRPYGRNRDSFRSRGGKGFRPDPAAGQTNPRRPPGPDAAACRHNPARSHRSPKDGRGAARQIPCPGTGTLTSP